MCRILALAGKKPWFDAVEHRHHLGARLILNITPVLANMVASVLGMTYKSMEVKKDSIWWFVERTCPGKVFAGGGSSRAGGPGVTPNPD